MTSLLDWEGWPTVVGYVSIFTAAGCALALVALFLRKTWPHADWRLGLEPRVWRLTYFRTLRLVTLAAVAWGAIDPWRSAWAGSALAILLLSALAVWFWDRCMCGHELLYWLLMAALTVFLTPAGAA